MDRDADGVKDAKTEGVSEQTSRERVQEDDGDGQQEGAAVRAAGRVLLKSRMGRREGTRTKTSREKTERKMWSRAQDAESMDMIGIGAVTKIEGVKRATPKGSWQKSADGRKRKKKRRQGTNGQTDGTLGNFALGTFPVRSVGTIFEGYPRFRFRAGFWGVPIFRTPPP